MICYTFHLEVEFYNELSSNVHIWVKSAWTDILLKGCHFFLSTLDLNFDTFSKCNVKTNVIFGHILSIRVRIYR